VSNRAKAISLSFLLIPLGWNLASAATFTVSGVPDSKVGYQCAISAGTNTLTCQDLTFASTDVGHAVVVYGAVENVNTTSTTQVSPGTVTVTPESMANIVPGTALWVQNANGSDGEQLAVTAVTSSSFTATFTKPKSGTWSIVTNYLALYTTVWSVTNSSTAVLAAAATNTVASAMVQVVGATDNRTYIQNAINAACAAATAENPSTVSFPAGIYGLLGSLYVPNGCSNVSWTATGQVTLLAAGIASTTATNPRYGQGGGVLSFGVWATAPGTATAALTNNTTIAAGTNVLSCGAGCSFTTKDIGEPLYLEYAGGSGLPLWTTITGVSGTPVNGIYPAVTLANDAQVSLPLTAQGQGDPLIVFGYQMMTNINIGGINFQNVGYWFHPQFTLTGVPLVNFGSGGQIVKQGITFHDTTITTATNGCLANNGPLDQFTFENITCLGGTDGAIFMAGDSSNGLLQNVIVNNTGYPTNTPLSNGILTNNFNHSVINGATVHCNCIFTTLEIGDYANFDSTIENSLFDGKGTTPVGVGSNITSGLSILNSTIENVEFAFRFWNLQASGINGITISGNTILNTNNALWSSDGSNTGYGPANISFTNNTAQVSGNAISAQFAGDNNSWSGNNLVHNGSSAAYAWEVTAGNPYGMNSVDSNQTSGFNNAENSCTPKARCQ
jgi:hypothetical protein